MKGPQLATQSTSSSGLHYQLIYVKAFQLKASQIQQKAFHSYAIAYSQSSLQ